MLFPHSAYRPVRIGTVVALTAALACTIACKQECPKGTTPEGSVCRINQGQQGDSDAASGTGAGIGGAGAVPALAGSGGSSPLATTAGPSGTGSGGSSATRASSAGSTAGPGVAPSSGAPSTGSAGASASSSSTTGGSAAGSCPGGGTPNAEECDMLDNDCDGMIDENLSMACGSSAQGICHMGSATCVNGQWGECVGAVEPMTEVCDQGMEDENCNGTGNEGCDCMPGETKSCGGQGLCMMGMQTCTTDGKWADDCSIKPKAEICDGVADEDCDGRIDNGCECTNGKSEDCSNAGQGVCRDGTRVCEAGKWTACNSKVNKSAEVCDGLDNDCDGMSDNNACMNGLKCIDKKCVQCTTNSDCDAGQTCVNTMCVAATGPCSSASANTCSVFSATCENRSTVSGMRYDLCRWSVDQSQCDAVGGIWTTADSTFAQNSPGSVPSGGACISQATNLTCSADHATKCAGVGATCDSHADIRTSTPLDICRWANATMGTCVTTTNMPGIWTTTMDTSFVTNCPSCIFPRTSGACIRDASNDFTMP